MLNRLLIKLSHLFANRTIMHVEATEMSEQTYQILKDIEHIKSREQVAAVLEAHYLKTPELFSMPLKRVKWAVELWDYEVGTLFYAMQVMWYLLYGRVVTMLDRRKQRRTVNGF